MLLCSVKSPHSLCPGLTVAIHFEFRLVSQSDNNQYTLYWYDRGARGIMINLVIRSNPNVWEASNPAGGTVSGVRLGKYDCIPGNLCFSHTEYTVSMHDPRAPALRWNTTYRRYSAPPMEDSPGKCECHLSRPYLGSKSPTWEVLNDIRIESQHILIHLPDAPHMLNDTA